MRAYEITSFRRYLGNDDQENLENRRAFHENYEWLEGYWRSNLGGNFFDKAWKKYGAFYWQNVPEIQNIARVLATLPPVGNNKRPNYDPSQEVVDATNLLQVLNKTDDIHFRALMLIVQQIRNNLFHGMKMQLGNQPQYERNKQLVRFARAITDAILDRLEDAENTCP